MESHLRRSHGSLGSGGKPVAGHNRSATLLWSIGKSSWESWDMGCYTIIYMHAAYIDPVKYYDGRYINILYVYCIVKRSLVMVASFVSAPATRAVYQNVCHIFCACGLAIGQADFQNVGVCACRPCSSTDWLSLRLPPVQFTGVFAHSVVMVQYDAAGFVGHLVLSGSHAGLSWDCSLCLAMLFVIHLFWCALRLID